MFLYNFLLDRYFLKEVFDRKKAINFNDFGGSQLMAFKKHQKRRFFFDQLSLFIVPPQKYQDRQINYRKEVIH